MAYGQREKSVIELHGKVALVTGGSRGIGRQLIASLSRSGADVAFCYRSDESAATTACAEILEQTGRTVLPVQADITAGADRKRLVAETRERFGTIDILVNNAGSTEDGLAVRMTGAWERVLELDLTAPFRLCQLVLPLMMKRTTGRIINIGSIASRVGLAGQANYTAAKAGLEGLTRSLAQEYGRRGITVNTVSPGFLETELTANADDFVRRYVTDHSSTGRFVTPEAIASAVLFLASDDAWAITGQTIHVDGGLVKL